MNECTRREELAGRFPCIFSVQVFKSHEESKISRERRSCLETTTGIGSKYRKYYLGGILRRI